MPPRTVKRGAGSAGPKRTTRGRRRAQKAQDPPPDEVAVVAAAAAVVEAKEALKVEEEVPAPVVEEEVKVEEKPVVVVEPEPKAKLVANGSGPVKNHTKWVGAFHKKQDFIDVVERRYQAVGWLESLVGPLDISKQPSEREFISCLRNGLVLCNAINKINPGAVPKVVENLSHLQSVPWESQPLPAYQYFENVRNILVAVEELKLPGFEA